MIPLIGAAVALAISAGAGAKLGRRRKLRIKSKTTESDNQNQYPLVAHPVVNEPMGSDNQTQAVQPTTQVDLTNQQNAEHMLNRQLMLSGVALGTTSMGLFFFHPLGILTTPLFVYLEWPLYKSTKRDLTEHHTIKVDGLTAIFTTITWLTGAYVASTLTIFTLALSDVITARTRARSQKKLIEIFDQQPRTVWRLVDGIEVETPYHLVQAGDLLVVQAGQIIPVDGVIHEGMGMIDQQRLTGEAHPVDKGTGETVFAATLVVRGRLLVRVDNAGQATLAAQIGQILNQTTEHHLAVEERGIALADKSVIPSLLLGVGAFPFYGFHSAVVVLSAMPGVDMHYAGPLALLNCLQLTTQQGILVKDGRSLELLHTIDTVVFDKTGTLTLEQPTVVEVHPLGVFTANELLIYAATAEQHQSHPIAHAILAAAQARNLTLPSGDDVLYEVGYGVQVRILRSQVQQTEVTGSASERIIDDSEISIRVGSERFMLQDGIAIPHELHSIQERCAALGHALVYIGVNEKLAGVLELHTTIRPEAQTVITALRNRGLKLYLLSGDQIEPTRYLAEQLGIEHYAANVLPTAKAQFITDLQTKGHQVCFVGDGINDAIALKQAQVSISLRGATTIATDTAQIVLMEHGLRQLPVLFDLANRLERNLLTSLKLSMGTGVIILTGALAFQMTIADAVIVGLLATLAIVGNAMKPLLFKLNPQENQLISTDSQTNEENK